jgi:hypothetical protein
MQREMRAFERTEMRKRAGRKVMSHLHAKPHRTHCIAGFERPLNYCSNHTALLAERDHAEQPVSIIIRTSSKEELIGLAAIPAIAELQLPELVV